MIDAAEMGEAPGTIRWILEDEIDGMSASTHSMPLSILTHYLQLAIDCDVRLLGIQVASNEVGEAVSPEVIQAIDEIVDELDRSICGVISSRP
jgi:hydrogenase 3 maturation protease